MPNYVYKFLLDKNGQIVYPRTPLSAIDVTTTNGIQISGDTMSVVFATKEQIAAGEPGHVISADGLKEAIAAYGNAFYTAGGGIDIQGGTVFAKPAPILSILDGTKDRGDSVTNANLNGALNLGRAVDVTTFPVTKNTFTSASNYIEIFTEDGVEVTDNCIQLTKTSPTANSYYHYSWSTIPKFAPGLKYLVMADAQNRGDANVLVVVRREQSAAMIPISGVPDKYTFPSLSDGGGTWVRLASLYTTEGSGGFFIQALNTTDIDIRLKHYMVFEVTALSDEAIYALATMPHPEKIYEKYLVKKDAVCPWINIINMQYSAAVTIGAGLSYKLIANDGNDHTLMVDTFPENAHGRDAFITLFVGDAEHILVKSPLVLMDPLTPNAVNNCTVKFRDGYARIYVTDTDYGYTVTVTGGSTDGSLKYGLVSTTEEYIVIAGTLDGERISFDGAVVPANRKTNILGHGTDKTTLTGNVAPVATMEMHQLSLSDVNVTGGTMIVPRGVEMNNGTTTVSNGLVVISGGVIGNNGDVVVSGGTLFCKDAYMNDGAVISVSGGSFVVEKVTGAGSDSVIDFGYNSATQTGGTNVVVSSNTTANVSGCIVANGYTSSYGGAIFVSGGNATFNGVLFRNCHGNLGGAVAVFRATSEVHLSSCAFDGNTANRISANALYIERATVVAVDCEFREAQNVRVASIGDMKLGGSNTFKASAGGAGTVSLVSGAIVDLTSNTNATPIAPEGGIVMQDNVRILYDHDSAGHVLPTSSVTEISGGTYGGITNYGVLKGPMRVSDGETITGATNVVIDLGGSNIFVSNATCSASNCTFNNGSTTTTGGAVNISGGSCVFEDCVFSGNVASNGTSSTQGGAIYITQTTQQLYPELTLSNCVFKNNFAYGYGGAIRCANATTTIIGCVVSGNSGATGHGIMAFKGTTILSNTVVTSNVGRTGEFDSASQIYQSRGILSINGGCTLGYIGVNGTANGDVTAPDGSMCFSGSNFVSSAAVNSTGIVIISGGAIITLGTNIRAATTGRVTVQTSGCTVNGHVIPAGSYTTINSDGTTT